MTICHCVQFRNFATSKDGKAFKIPRRSPPPQRTSSSPRGGLSRHPRAGFDIGSMCVSSVFAVQLVEAAVDLISDGHGSGKNGRRLREPRRSRRGGARRDPAAPDRDLAESGRRLVEFSDEPHQPRKPGRRRRHPPSTPAPRPRPNRAWRSDAINFSSSSGLTTNSQVSDSAGNAGSRPDGPFTAIPFSTLATRVPGRRPVRR